MRTSGGGAAFAVLFALATGLRAQTPQGTPSDESLIRAARAHSNQAIAAHDTVALASGWLPEFVLVSSNNAQSIGRDAASARFAEIFATRPDVIYVRTPDSVTVNTSWGQAGEYGHWTGRWTQADGITTVGGRYFAKWRKMNDRWLLLAETFVQTSCSGSSYCKPLLLDPGNAEWTRPAPAVSRLSFETTKGIFVLELQREWGPIGADRFYNLARLGYYDDTRVHRVNKGYIAQFGLHGDPRVNAAWKERYLADDPPRSNNVRGSFAFSYKGPGNPNTRNTQIYINLADNPRSDPEHFTVLGRVVEGMAVLDSLHSGYGENSGSGVRQGRQGPLEAGGNAFMDREYPLLDRILRVTVKP